MLPHIPGIYVFSIYYLTRTSQTTFSSFLSLYFETHLFLQNAKVKKQTKEMGLMLQKCNLIIKHVESKGNVIADALSRVGYGCSEFMQRFLVKSLYSDFFLFISSIYVLSI
jgi:hypothetical protein